MTSSTTTTTSSPSTSPSPAPSKKFRLASKKFFLTFPQCSVTKEQAQERLQNKFPEELEWFIIGEEKHQDGTPHLHLALCFHNQKSVTRPDYFDFIGDKHGNYQTMKSQQNCVKYVVKGGIYVQNGIDVASVLAKKASKSAFVAKQILDGKTIKEVAEEDPGFFMMNKRKIEEYEAFVKRHKNLNLQEWKKIPDADICDYDEISDMEISAWLNLNVKEPREFRQPQLYIYGPPKLGKSTLISNLEKYLRVYHIPRDEDFYDGYDDDLYDLAVLDEAKSTKTMQWMNQWLDGQKFYLRQKGRQYLKTKNIPTIVLSNYSLEHNYKKLYEKGELEPLLTRFKIVEVKSFIQTLLQEKDT